jgi:ABC-type nitrate/sulfonate/bicarbonate transport system substrate-binding protein
LRPGAARLAALALIGALSACTPAPEDDLDVVRLAVQERFSEIPLLLADAKGHFRRRGIRIHRVRIRQGSEALPLLIRGTIDAASMALAINLLSAVEQGADIRLVANKGALPAGHCAQSGLMARGDWAPPEDPAELRRYLRGRRIAITSSSGASFFVSTLLDSLGLEERDVEIFPLPEPARVDALAAGRIDLAQIGEPNVTRLLPQGFVMWRSMEQVLPGRDQSFIVFSSRLTRQDRKLGHRFLAAYLDWLEDYGRGKTEDNVAVVAQETGFEPELLKAACWPAMRPGGGVDLETIALIGTWAVEQGLLDRAPTAESLVDRAILKEARELRDRRPGSGKTGTVPVD